MPRRGQRPVLSVANTRRDAGSPENYFFFKNGRQPSVVKAAQGFWKKKFLPFFFFCVLMDFRRFLNASKRNKPARDKMHVQASKIKPERIL